MPSNFPHLSKFTEQFATESPQKAETKTEAPKVEEKVKKTPNKLQKKPPTKDGYEELVSPKTKK